MNTKEFMPVLITILLTVGSVKAFADGGWSYDEDTDTVIFNYVGSNVARSISQSEHDTVEHTGPWYYDEDTETIVFNNEGSRSSHARANPSIEPRIDGFIGVVLLDQ